MLTLETRKDIAIDMEVRFGELWDGNGNGEELLSSGAVSPDNENIVAFKITEICGNILNTIVKVTDIY